MLSTRATQLATVAPVAVGFALGWVWRGWRDRMLAEKELWKHGLNPEDFVRFGGP